MNIKFYLIYFYKGQKQKWVHSGKSRKNELQQRRKKQIKFPSLKEQTQHPINDDEED